MPDPEAPDPIRDVNVMGELAVVGALALNYLSTTHSDHLGHDLARCPVGARGYRTTPTRDDIERCRCGWATLYAKYLVLMGVRP